MNNEINISESEWTVMEYLWNNPMVTITEIRKELSSTGWSDSTIKTLVRRLVSKNAVAINDEAATFRYFPLISQQECRLKETKSFINRVYDGSVSMLVTNLVADSNLTDKETEELLTNIFGFWEGKTANFFLLEILINGFLRIYQGKLKMDLI